MLIEVSKLLLRGSRWRKAKAAVAAYQQIRSPPEVGGGSGGGVAQGRGTDSAATQESSKSRLSVPRHLLWTWKGWISDSRLRRSSPPSGRRALEAATDATSAGSYSAPAARGDGS